MKNYKDKTVLITGASSGIGESFAKQLDELGSKLILTARSKDKLNKLASQMNDAIVISGDLSDRKFPKKLYKEVPFFRALMHNSMMSLAKSNFNLTGYMKEDPEFGDFWNILHDEFQLSKKMLLQISGDKMLMEDEAVSRESVKIREKIVLPLLVIQQNALYHITQNSEYKELYEKIVTRSLYGNINASRNSA